MILVAIVIESIHITWIFFFNKEKKCEYLLLLCWFIKYLWTFYAFERPWIFWLKCSLHFTWLFMTFKHVRSCSFTYYRLNHNKLLLLCAFCNNFTKEFRFHLFVIKKICENEKKIKFSLKRTLIVCYWKTNIFFSLKSLYKMSFKC